LCDRFFVGRSFEHHLGVAGTSRPVGIADPCPCGRSWMDLLKPRPVTGSSVFDLQIVATMLANGVNRIYSTTAMILKSSPSWQL